MRSHSRSRKVLRLFLTISLLLQTVICASEDPAESRRYVALTFDDGPTGSVTRSLLEVLRQRQVPATFFLCGYRIAQAPELVQSIAAQGHELGIHGQSHAYLHKKTSEEVIAELTQPMNLLTGLTGVQPVLFRPPGGLCSEMLLSRCGKLNLSVILWSVDPEDWCCTDVRTVTDRVIAQTHPGDIILLHDLNLSSVQAAAEIIDQLQSQGYTFVTVSQLARITGTKLLPGRRYFRLSG